MMTRAVLQALIGGGAVASLIAVGPVPKILSPKNGMAITEAWIKVAGSGEPGRAVGVFDGDRFVARAMVLGSGDWTVDASLQTGKHSLSAAYEGAAGYGSRSKAVKVVVKDLLKPLDRKLEILNAKDGDIVPAGAFRLRGMAAPGRRIQVAVNGGRAFFKAAEEDGSWEFNLFLEKGPDEIELRTAVEPRESVTFTLIAE